MMTLDDADWIKLLECFHQTEHSLSISRLHQLTGLQIGVLHVALLRLVKTGQVIEIPVTGIDGLVSMTYRLRIFMEDDYQAPRKQRHAGTKKSSRVRSLSLNEQYFLVQRIQEKQDQRAETELILNFLPWISSIAHSVCWDKGKHADLVQVGCQAFVAIMRKFDVRTNGTLYVFCYQAVRGKMLDYLVNKDKLIPLPRKVRLALRSVRLASEQLRQRYHREPTFKEIAETTGLTELSIRQLLESQQTQSPDSLDALMEEADAGRSEQFIQDPQASSPDEVAEIFLLLQKLERSSTFSVREKEILRWRHIVPPTQRRKTLEELATEFGISTSRVQQIEARAVEKFMRKYGRTT